MIMDFEEDRRIQPVMGVLAEDLSLLSLRELRDRIKFLQSEINRCEDIIATKEGAMVDAESFFKK